MVGTRSSCSSERRGEEIISRHCSNLLMFGFIVPQIRPPPRLRSQFWRDNGVFAGVK